MQSILNMSAPRSGKLYKEKAPRAECFFWLRGLDLNCTVLHFFCGENAAVSSAALTVRRTVIHYRLTLRVIRPRAHTPRSGELYKEKHPVRNAFLVAGAGLELHGLAFFLRRKCCGQLGGSDSPQDCHSLPPHPSSYSPAGSYPSVG